MHDVSIILRCGFGTVKGFAKNLYDACEKVINPKADSQKETSLFPTPAKFRPAVAEPILTRRAVKRRRKRPPAHHRRRRTQNRLHKAACFAIVCFMKMNAPERNSFFRNEGEPCNTQYIVVACSFLYIIQFISHFFKGKNAVLSFLNMRNDDLHNIFRLSLCIIFLIFLVLELL